MVNLRLRIKSRLRYGTICYYLSSHQDPHISCKSITTAFYSFAPSHNHPAIICLIEKDCGLATFLLLLDIWTMVMVNLLI